MKRKNIFSITFLLMVLVGCLISIGSCTESERDLYGSISGTVTDAETGRIEVWNRNHFTDASAYDINWELWENGNMLQQGTLALTTAPLECEEITVPYRRPDIVPGKEYRLLIRALLKQEECWAPAGHEVAWDELELPWHIAAPLTTKNEGIPSYMLTDTTLMVWGNHFYYVFDRKEDL